MGDLSSQSISISNYSATRFIGRTYLHGISIGWIALLVVSLVCGQLVRFSLPGQGGGVLLSDIATTGLIMWSFFLAVVQKRHVDPFLYGLLGIISAFSIWACIGLFIRSVPLELYELAIAGAYWIRLVTLLLLLPALLLLFHDTTIYTWSKRTWIIGCVLIGIAGFFQLLFLPNINPQALPGWDPHQGRLVSTWLDPNLLGGFFILLIPWIAGQAIQKKSFSYSVLTIGLSAALIATKSRSSFLSLGAVMLLSPFLSYWVIRGNQRRVRLLIVSAIASILVGCLLVASVLLGERFVGIIHGDATTTLRIDSLQANLIELALPNSLLGTGYNAYQFAAQEKGFIDTFTVHSRAGSDNSFLNIWITTGLPGLILFTALWVFIAWRLVVDWRRHKNSEAIGVALGLVFIGIQSAAVNSFLYAHNLIAIALLVSFALKKKSSL